MPVFTGTDGPETLTGTEGDDDFYPLGGNDTVHGLGGDDRYFGVSGLGSDGFRGGDGYDTARQEIHDLSGTLSFLVYTDSVQVYQRNGQAYLGATDTERLEIVLGGSNSRMTEFVVHLSSQPASLDFHFDGRANLNGFSYRHPLSVDYASFTVLGSEFDDVLSGGSELFGYGGNDTLRGAERMAGGAGNDTYDLGQPGTVITELAGEGIDTIRAGRSSTLPDHIENLRGVGAGADSIGRGNGEANSISGFGHAFGMAGDDVLTGVRVSGGTGNDLLQGVGSADTADYSTAASGVFVTLDSATPTATDDGDGGVDTLVGIENLTGSAFNDILIGDGAANVLTGGAGGDYLIALAGNDLLIGGTGAANQMQGGQGDDRYVVSVAGDTVLEFAGEGTDTVDTSLSALTLRNHVEVLRFTGVGSFSGSGNGAANLIVGGVSADTLTGMGGDDRLEGLEGADIFRGGAGSDHFVGGDNFDTADYSAAAAGVTVKLNMQTATNDGDGAADTFEAIENVVGSAFNDVLIGANVVNVLTGGAGADYLIGLGGHDTLIGGSGAANQMQGGADNDRYIVTAVGDTVIEFAGEGTDTVETTLAAFTLRQHVENLIYTGAAAFTGVGNVSNNVMTGGAGADTFTGGRGDDTVNGGLGTDTVLMAGVRADYTVQAGAGYVTIGDSVVGRDGIDTLVGVERIRFSDGTVLDITPPASGLPEDPGSGAAEAVLPRFRPTGDIASDDFAVTLHPFASPWDLM